MLILDQSHADVDLCKASLSKIHAIHLRAEKLRESSDAVGRQTSVPTEELAYYRWTGKRVAPKTYTTVPIGMQQIIESASATVAQGAPQAPIVARSTELPDTGSFPAPT